MNEVCLLFSGFVTVRRMGTMLGGVGNKLKSMEEHNDESDTLKRILDEGAK